MKLNDRGFTNRGTLNDQRNYSKQYQRDRKPKYPDIGDQLDMIYHAGLGGDEFQEAIKIVKNKYPK